MSKAREKLACQCDVEAHKGFTAGDLVTFAPTLKEIDVIFRIWRKDEDNRWSSWKNHVVDLYQKVDPGSLGVFMDYNPVSPELHGCSILLDGRIGAIHKANVHHAGCEKARLRNAARHPNYDSSKQDT